MLRRRVGLRRTGPPKRRRSPNDFPPDIRAAILVRDNWTCQAAVRLMGLPYGQVVHPAWRGPCQGTRQAHHIWLRRKGYHELDGGLTLCSYHHGVAHDVDREGAEEMGIIRRGDPPKDRP